MKIVRIHCVSKNWLGEPYIAFSKMTDEGEVLAFRRVRWLRYWKMIYLINLRNSHAFEREHCTFKHHVTEPEYW